MNLRRVTGKTPQRKIVPHLSPFEIRVIIDVSEVSISVSDDKNHVKNIFLAVQQKHQLLVHDKYIPVHDIPEVSWIAWFYELLAFVFKIGYKFSRKCAPAK